jgi:Ca2+-binding RTX toxin-like protein
VAPEDADAVLEAWAADAAYLKAKPGFISTQLYRGIAGSGVFVNHADGGVGGCCAQAPNSGFDKLFGGEGDDVLWSADFGNTNADGGPGNDDVYGGPNSDVIIGGAGLDRMWGGAGSDELGTYDGSADPCR